ncbi:MAG: zinc metallopeptidase [Ruminococcaceae bacterium]|nr:zinc metallopeptidase [Oscillospiraceae bacterium]
MPYFYGIDMSYIVYVLPAILFALWAQINVKSTFKKYSKTASENGMTGRDAARLILDANGLHHVQVTHVQGDLTDHFDPKTNIIRLSDSTYEQATAAAVGVAAHEAGHAVQYAEGYVPMKIRSAIIPATNIGSNLAFPLVLLGIVFSMPGISYIGILLFGLSVLFQLVTLPVEFNASRRAMAAIKDSGRVSENGEKAAKKVLTAAAMTYVAALAVALGNMLRLIALVNRGRRR